MLKLRLFFMNQNCSNFTSAKVSFLGKWMHALKPSLISVEHGKKIIFTKHTLEKVLENPNKKTS